MKGNLHSAIAGAVVVGLLVASCGPGETQATSATSAPAVAQVDAPTDPTEEPGPTAPVGDSPADASPESTVAVQTDPTPVPSTAEVPSTDYPSFAAMTSTGEAFELADFAGQDVLLWFWAPW